MPKPTVLNSDALLPSATGPAAATSPRVTSPKTPAPAKPELMPLQVRWPREAVRAAKIAAAEREQTVSEFMLTCFHASMKA